MSRSIGKGLPNLGHNNSSATSRVTYVNEKSRIGRDYSRIATPRPRNTQKGNLSLECT